jgi:hypothetical protein
VSVPVAVRFKASMPPRAYMMFVVVAPLFVICWRVAVVAADPGQFVPLARQTFDPFTWMLEAKRLVPLAVPKERIVEVL